MFTIDVQVWIAGNYVGVRTMTKSAFRAFRALGRKDVQLIPADNLRR